MGPAQPGPALKCQKMCFPFLGGVASADGGLRNRSGVWVLLPCGTPVQPLARPISPAGIPVSTQCGGGGRGCCSGSMSPAPDGSDSPPPPAFTSNPPGGGGARGRGVGSPLRPSSGRRRSRRCTSGGGTRRPPAARNAGPRACATSAASRGTWPASAPAPARRRSVFFFKADRFKQIQGLLNVFESFSRSIFQGPGIERCLKSKTSKIQFFLSLRG